MKGKIDGKKSRMNFLPAQSIAGTAKMPAASAVSKVGQRTLIDTSIVLMASNVRSYKRRAGWDLPDSLDAPQASVSGRTETQPNVPFRHSALLFDFNNSYRAYFFFFTTTVTGDAYGPGPAELIALTV